jgi:uroporphyrinogen decarboxylase
MLAERGGTPLRGCACVPFTLSCYLVDGGPSKTFDRTRALMYGNPALWDSLLGRLADITITFLQVQVEAGASAVQLFDSWAGILSPADYRRSGLPHSRRIFAALASAGVPAIHFGVGTGELLGLLGEAGADVVGVDWRVPLDEAVHRVAPGKALQGNLDPAARPVAGDRGTARGVEKGRTAEPHLYLGHGVLPGTNRVLAPAHRPGARDPAGDGGRRR